MRRAGNIDTGEAWQFRVCDHCETQEPDHLATDEYIRPSHWGYLWSPHCGTFDLCPDCVGIALDSMAPAGKEAAK